MAEIYTGFNCTIEGEYLLSKGKKLGGKEFVIQELGPFKNLITNAGLDRFGSNTDVFSRCLVGSGNTPPSPNDTWLESLISHTNNQQGRTTWSGSLEPEHYIEATVRYRFGEGEAAGNVSEVGMSWGTSPGSLFSRALVRDSFGNPTSISILPDEYLDVTYTYRVYFQNQDVIGTITLENTPHDYVMRLVGTIGRWFPSEGHTGFQFRPGNNNGQALTTGLVDKGVNPPSGSAAGERILPSYVSNSLQREWTERWGLNNGNLAGGIKSVWVYPLYDGIAWGSSPPDKMNIGYAQVEFDPPIPKTNTKVLDLNFKWTWGRRPV